MSDAEIAQVMSPIGLDIGARTPEEIIASVSRGLYAVNFGGGSVDITSGKFVFSATEAYLIEDGRVTQPVKGATLIGNGPEIMTRVSMVGNDLALDEGVKLLAGHLQQLNRLLQLGRDDQPLSLPDLKSRAERQNPCPHWPVSCFRLGGHSH